MSEPVFFSPARSFTAGEIAGLTGAMLHRGELDGVEIDGLGTPDHCGSRDLVFVSGKANADRLASLRAGAVIVPDKFADRVSEGVAVLVSKAPQRDFAMVGRLLFPAAASPEPVTGETGISPAAHVADTAMVEEGAIVEAGAVIGPGAEIGSGTVIAPNAVIAKQVRIGRNCAIGAGVTIRAALIGNHVIIHEGARIGQDGFGFVPGRQGLEKVPQIGRVIIQDHVEIGANTTIDRGALSDTVIGEGAKIDNLVQIAHNVRIGRHTVIAGLTGIAGSCTLGDGVMVGGGAGFVDHVNVGDGAQIAAGSGILHDVPAGERWGGRPAKPLRVFIRELAEIQKLGETRGGRRGQ